MIQWDDTPRHISDADLVRLMDGECSPSEEHEARSHLRSCTSCRERLDLLVRTSNRLSRALESLGSPGSEPGDGSVRRRITKRGVGAVGALLVVGLAAGPVWGWLTGRGAEERVAVPIVSFVPGRALLTIEVQHRQSAGSLTLTVDTMDAVSTRIFGDGSGPEIMVLSGGLRIVNDPQSRLSYELRLPATLREVEVIVADSVVFQRRIGMGVAGAKWQLSLTPPEPLSQ